MRCPYCLEPIAGTTERDYAVHLARCAQTPTARRAGAEWCTLLWRDPRPEMGEAEALRLSVAMGGRWGSA